MKKRLLALLILTLALGFFAAPVAAAPDTPLLQITSVSTYPEAVSPGDNFDVFLSVVNNGNYNAYNTNIEVLNISGSKTNDLDVFSMSGSGNHVYLGQVSSFEATSATLHMAVSPAATAKNYNLNLNITTVDGNGNAYSFPETIGLFVNEATSMSLIVPDQITLKDSTDTVATTTDSENKNLKVEIANLGSNSVRGVQLSLVGDGVDVADSSTYYGTFEKDDSDSVATTVTSDTPGDHTIVATLNYVDSFNNERQVVKNIKVVVPDSATTSSTANTAKGDGSSGSILGNIVKVIFGITF